MSTEDRIDVEELIRVRKFAAGALFYGRQERLREDVAALVRDRDSTRLALQGAVEALKNLLGAYDTPLSRRRFPPTDFMLEAIASGHTALTKAQSVLDGAGEAETAQYEIPAALADELSAAVRDVVAPGHDDLLAEAERVLARYPDLLPLRALHAKITATRGETK